MALRSLAELILKNVEIVEADLQNRGAEGPSIDEPFVPGADINFGNPAVSEAIYLTTCAAQQLLQTIRPPQACLLQEVSSVSIQHSIPEQGGKLKFYSTSACRARFSAMCQRVSLSGDSLRSWPGGS